MSCHELEWLRFDARLTKEEVLEVTGRSERTWRRWKAEGIPKWVVELLRLRAGYLDALGWIGWRIENGYIFAPELKKGFSQEDIYAIWWQRQAWAHDRRVLRQTRENEPGDVVQLREAEAGEPPSRAERSDVPLRSTY